MKQANASYAEVVKASEEFLIVHNFKNAGKGGYDAKKHTLTVHDYEGQDRLFVSVGPDGTKDLSRVERVFIGFYRDRDSFSPESAKILKPCSQP